MRILYLFNKTNPTARSVGNNLYQLHDDVRQFPIESQLFSIEFPRQNMQEARSNPRLMETAADVLNICDVERRVPLFNLASYNDPLFGVDIFQLFHLMAIDREGIPAILNGDNVRAITEMYRKTKPALFYSSPTRAELAAKSGHLFRALA